jgi:hypothetical protein
LQHLARKPAEPTINILEHLHPRHPVAFFQKKTDAVECLFVLLGQHLVPVLNPIRVQVKQPFKVLVVDRMQGPIVELRPMRWMVELVMRLRVGESGLAKYFTKFEIEGGGGGGQKRRRR